MKRHTVARIVMLFFLFFLLGGCGGGDSSSPNSSLFFASETFSIPVSEAGKTGLTVLGVNGIVEINEDATVTTISITGVMKVGSFSLDDAQQHLGDLDVIVTDQGDEVIVETVQPQNSEGRNYIVEYIITIPDAMQINSSQANGETNIQTINSSITASQANGTIGVVADLPLNGTIKLSIANGNISLTIPTDTSATLSCLSATGTITTSNLTVLNPIQTSHSLLGTLGVGSGDISISTANGDIAISGR